MALPPILEGTWEEIKLRDEELAGQYLRVIIGGSGAVGAEQMQPGVGSSNLITDSDAERVMRIKSLRGKYAHLGVSVEDLHSERANDKTREKQSLEDGSE